VGCWIKGHRTAGVCLPRLDAQDDGKNPSYILETGGQPGTHRRTAAVDGEAAAGSQEGRAASGGVSSPEGVGCCSGSVSSSDGGAPRQGPTTTLPANSAQGKGSWGLAEVSGWVFGGKRGPGEWGEGGHLLGGSQRAPALSPLLAAARGRGWAALPRR
jgi:hypothetical protein